MWQLKKNQPPFEVVDGPMRGRKFAYGQIYQEIPEGQEFRFVDAVGVSAVSTTADCPANEIVDLAPAKNDEQNDKEVADA